MIKRPIFAIAGSFVLGEVLALLNVADISRIYGGLGAALLGCSLTLGKWRSRSGDSFLLFFALQPGEDLPLSLYGRRIWHGIWTGGKGNSPIS